jgi:hypothetical protein
VAAAQISRLTDTNFQKENINVLLWSSIEPNLTVIIASVPTLRLLRASRAISQHQKLSSRDKIRINNARKGTHDRYSRGLSPIAVGPPIFRQQTTATRAASTNSAPPPRPPRPTSNQSFWTDSSSILKGGDNAANLAAAGCSSSSLRGLAHEASTEHLILQSPLNSPTHPPYSPSDTNPARDEGAVARDSCKPSSNGRRLTTLEEESSLRGSCVSNSNNNNINNNNNNYRTSSKYSTSAFIDAYGSQARNVVQGMELVVPGSQPQQPQQQQQQPQQQWGRQHGGQGQYSSPQYYQQYQQQYAYPQQNQQQNQNQNLARQHPSQHRRKPPVTEATLYGMFPVTATGGYGGML